MEKFEGDLKRLEEIVQKLEKGNLPLDKSLSLYEEGIKLCKSCNTKLESANKKVEIFYKDESGKLETKPFETKGQNKDQLF